jgi:hypothetical protein
MRALVGMLLAANLGFFVLAQGWLEPILSLHAPSQREPQRLAAQINPETVRVLTPPGAGAASSAAAAALVCVQAGPFTADQIGVAEAWIAPLQMPTDAWQRTRVDDATQWQVVLGNFADNAALVRRHDALRAEGIDAEILPAAGAASAALALGRFDDKAGAELALAQWQQRGLSDAALASVALTEYGLRVPRADAGLADRLLRLPPLAPDRRFEPCP